jgi:hypothetical protein
MKTLKLRGLIFGSLLILLVACEKKNDIDCPGAPCPRPDNKYVFTIVDEESGINLLSGINPPRYNTSDIELYSGPGRTGSNISFEVDTLGDILAIRTTTYATSYLVINGSAEYKIDLAIKQVNCCDWKVEKARINDQIVCLWCAGIIKFPVR